MRGKWSLAVRLVVAGVLVAGAAAAAPARHGRFDPRDLKGTQAGPVTQVLVLGTAHLGELKPPYQPEYLAPLLDRLAAWRPDMITIEGLSGADCDALFRYKAINPGTADQYCWDTDDARAATGLDVPAALAKVEETLAAWPASPTAADRRRLAAYFLAAGDRASATVQWLRLPAEERRAGDGVDDKLLAILTKTSNGRNENYRIAAALAARLGLERVYPTDDHSSDQTVAALGDDYGAAVQAAWKGGEAVHKDYEAHVAAIHDGDSLLGFYRYLNAPETNRATIMVDMGANLKEPSPQMFGRRYVGWWETRNLRMVANIRAAYVGHPGARVLCIVGATHKAYFESYLDMMSDTRIVDVQPFLR
jgi:hypothetical protein